MDEDHSNRPSKDTTSEMIAKIHVMLNDWKINVREIAETVSISSEQVQNVLTTHLDIKKTLRDCSQLTVNTHV